MQHSSKISEEEEKIMMSRSEAAEELTRNVAQQENTAHAQLRAPDVSVLSLFKLVIPHRLIQLFCTPSIIIVIRAVITIRRALL